MFQRHTILSLFAAAIACTAGAQDLHITDFTSNHGSRTLTPGMSIQLRIVVKNSPTLWRRASTPESVNGLYFSKDSTITRSDQLVRSFQNRALSSGKSVAVYMPIVLPKNTPNGYWHLGVVLDRYNRIKETNEGNNTKSMRVRCANQDLRALNMSASTPIISKGTRVRLTGSIVNSGSLPSYSTSSAYYLSSNATISTYDTFLGSWTTPALGVNRSHTYTGTYSMPATNRFPSLAYFGMIADYKNQLGEADERNNTANYLIRTEGEPEIRIESLSASTTSPIRGNKVSMKISMRNHGRKDSGKVSVRYWFKSLSGNPYTARDWQIGSFGVSPLRANARFASSYTHDVTIPAEIAAERTWYLRAIVNGVSREIRMTPRWPTAHGYYVGQTTREITASTRSHFQVATKRVGPLQPDTFYMFVVGASGASPGVSYGSLGHLHLNIDAYTGIGFGIHGGVFQNMLGKQNSSAAGNLGHVVGGAWVRHWPSRATLTAFYFNRSGILGFAKAPSLTMRLRR